MLLQPFLLSKYPTKKIRLESDYVNQNISIQSLSLFTIQIINYRLLENKNIHKQEVKYYFIRIRINVDEVCGWKNLSCKRCKEVMIKSGGKFGATDMRPLYEITLTGTNII